MSATDRSFNGGRYPQTGAIGVLQQVRGDGIRIGDTLISRHGAELIADRVHPSPHRPNMMIVDTDLGELHVPFARAVIVRRAGTPSENRLSSGAKKILAFAGNILTR
ncbi:hypothetical protein [Agromyces humi]|uniref:hypothetical protein n=1 Tax=Agromyces humi TaxID=1766800 RepID=UPI00135823E5|nr:hypothetical protein [Agromyces humi]